ncbi:uncharacterized protein [Eurosta solidaginis]
MPYEFDEYDRLVYIDESEVETTKDYDVEESSEEAPTQNTESKETVVNESSHEIERIENEDMSSEMKHDDAIERKTKTQKPFNWTSDYICKPRRERVKWDTKIYNLEKSLAEKALDEQAEQLMDASAERFTEWLNSLSSNHESDISKAQLKALFSIEGGRKTLPSTQTEPKEIKAIAKAVEDKLNSPEVAIELNYEHNFKELLNNVQKEAITVAFGRTVPYRDRPFSPLAREKPIKTVFPDELLSGEKLFKGIGHLRSVKALIEFYRENTHLARPSYLEKSGLFKMKEITTTKQEIPLYELLKLEY